MCLENPALGSWAISHDCLRGSLPALVSCALIHWVLSCLPKLFPLVACQHAGNVCVCVCVCAGIQTLFRNEIQDNSCSTYSFVMARVCIFYTIASSWLLSTTTTTTTRNKIVVYSRKRIESSTVFDAFRANQPTHYERIQCSVKIYCARFAYKHVTNRSLCTRGLGLIAIYWV